MQKLGDYIREVDVRNKDLKVTNLMGIKIDKHFMPSVANTIGTDLSNYKVVSKNQFACNLMHVGRDEKIPIAILLDENKIIVSPAYFTFEIINFELLLPEYLMMWFSRKEFDRNAWFYTDADVRGGMDKRTLMDMQLPIPSIEQQREIVSEYETISKRIKLNEQIIKNLEATAQTLYHKMFVEGIDKENLPEGWRIGTLTEVATYLNGIACQKYATSENNYLPVLKIRELSQGYCDENSDHVLLDVPNDYIINNGDVIFSWSATLFIDIWCGGKCVLNQHLFKVSSDFYPKWYYFMWTKNHIVEWKRLISAKATSMGHIKREDLDSAQVIIPSKEYMQKIDYNMTPIFSMYVQKKCENNKLIELQSLLLAKMGK